MPVWLRHHGAYHCPEGSVDFGVKRYVLVRQFRVKLSADDYGAVFDGDHWGNLQRKSAWLHGCEACGNLPWRYLFRVFKSNNFSGDLLQIRWAFANSPSFLPVSSRALCNIISLSIMCHIARAVSDVFWSAGKVNADVHVALRFIIQEHHIQATSLQYGSSDEREEVAVTLSVCHGFNGVFWWCGFYVGYLVCDHEHSIGEVFGVIVDFPEPVGYGLQGVWGYEVWEAAA